MAKKKEKVKFKTQKDKLLARQTAEAQKRRKVIGIFGSKAEALEIEAVNFDEVPTLKDMERQRTRKTMVSNRFLNAVERSVTDSFPD